ncbi:hypothetical protein MPSEU_000912500 [Mayamaea pseudoterrestris]|nr:hypothetical protein MPSEU_000912500 [Mayamaea pseudoterrestris]
MNQSNGLPPTHAHSWHNLRFANNGNPRGQSMMQLTVNRSGGGGTTSAAVANAFASQQPQQPQANSNWDPVPIGGRGLTSLLQNNPLFAGMEGAMHRSAAARASHQQQPQHPAAPGGNHLNQMQAPMNHSNNTSNQMNNQVSQKHFNKFDHDDDSQQQHQQQAKRQKTVSFATLSGADHTSSRTLQQPPSLQGNSVFPTQQIQEQLQRQQQQRSLAHAAQSTPNFSSAQSSNPFLNQMQQGGAMQNASFQNSSQASARPNPFLAQLQGNMRPSQQHQQQQPLQNHSLQAATKNHSAFGVPNKQVHQFASIFDDSKPSPLSQMRQQQQQQQQALFASLEPSRKRPTPNGSSFKYGFASTFARESASNPKLLFASMDGSSLLHNSCKLYPDTVAVVESAIAMDPEAVRRPISIVCCMKGVGGDTTSESSFEGATSAMSASSSSSENKNQTRKQRAQERFHYPLNIALKYNACYEILSLLAQTGPDVIALPDGPDRCTALATAIALERDARVIQLLLETNPEAAQVCDKQSNTPLHAAVRVAKPSPQVVELILRAYPQAIYEHNFHGETPLDMAVRNNTCSEQVLDFFQQHRDGDLQENLQDDLV